MVILSVYIAHVASADSGMLRGDTNDNEERPKVSHGLSILYSNCIYLSAYTSPYFNKGEFRTPLENQDYSCH